MAVVFDPTEGFAVVSDECQGCGDPFYDTGCGAPGCFGRFCVKCGTGCDIEIAPQDGLCAQAAAGESEEEALMRINAERVACGLDPFDADGNRISKSAKEQA